MSYQLEGTVVKIGIEQVISDKFKKRDFVVKVEGTYPQFIKMQLTQAKCDLANSLTVNQKVTAFFNLTGKEYTNKYGDVDYFSGIECWKIEAEADPVPTKTAKIEEEEGDIPF